MSAVKLARPEELIETEDDICSNFSHKINKKVLDQVKTGKFFACYPGWNFHAQIWFQGGQFHAEVWRFKSHIETVSAPTFDEVKSEICEKYGSD
jgi:hypothetical protein